MMKVKYNNMNVKELFIKNKNGDFIEGYLGDDEQAEILFLLREPNSGGEETDIFWFREVLENSHKFAGSAKRAGTKYKNVFGRLAQCLLHTNEDYAELLKRCAYINLYPFSGDNNSSTHYRDTLKQLKNTCNQQVERAKTISKKSEPEDIINNRLGILKSIGCKNIITTCDIFDALIKTLELNRAEKQGFQYIKNFNKAKYGDINIYDFYHPCYSINVNNIEI